MTTANTNDAGYNGWTDWTTWNVSLWLFNEEGIYNDLSRFVRFHIRSSELKAYALELMETTPDGARLEDADWDEIYQAFDEE